MQELYKESFKLRLKTQSSPYEGSVDYSKYRDGNCAACGEYDTELNKEGSHWYCREDKCRAARFIQAALEGKAGKGPDGDLWWNHD